MRKKCARRPFLLRCNAYLWRYCARNKRRVISRRIPLRLSGLYKKQDVDKWDRFRHVAAALHRKGIERRYLNGEDANEDEDEDEDYNWYTQRVLVNQTLCVGSSGCSYVVPRARSINHSLTNKQQADETRTLRRTRRIILITAPKPLPP